MNLAKLELDLKVWKELAISKQVLMLTATDALKLSPECTPDELKVALENVIKKIKESDSNVVAAQDQARQQVGVMERKLTASVQAQTAAETAMTNMRTVQARSAPQIAAERAAAAKEIQQLKDRVGEREKALKTINTALADTPENVIKKMKALRKEKQDEADLRRQVESSLAAVRKEKQQQAKQAAQERDNTVKLMTLYRDLHAVTLKLQEQLKPLLADGADVSSVPELDNQLLESIENPETAEKSDKA